MASVNLFTRFTSTKQESRVRHDYRGDLPPDHFLSYVQFPGGLIRAGPKRDRKNRSYFSCRGKGRLMDYDALLRNGSNERVAQISHYKSAVELEYRHWWFGIVTVALNAVVGSAVFSTLADLGVHRARGRYEPS